jgi:hypothetical protein
MNKPKTCHGCQHFFVTYERARPWGCGAYGFKSQMIPYNVVISTVGTDCAAYKQKVLPQRPAQSRTTGA